MNKQVELIKAEIKNQISTAETFGSWGYRDRLNSLLDFINSLPEELKFKVGDMVISTKNPSLTYKVLRVGLPNELGKLDYVVDIFTDGKAGIKVGNTFKEHNIHLISCDKMDEWGKLLEETVSEDLENFALQYAGHHAPYDSCMQEVEDAVKAGANWKEEQIMAKAINTEASFTMSVPSICISLPLGINVGDKVKVIVIKVD